MGMVHHQTVRRWRPSEICTSCTPPLFIRPGGTRPYAPHNHAPACDDGRIGLQIGSVPTPWPSWLIAAHPSHDRAPSHELRTFLEALSTYVVAFDAPENRAGPNVEFIKETFGYPEEDIGVKFILIRWCIARVDLGQTLGLA